MADIAEILNAPEDHGFVFVVETVKRDGRTSGPVPLVKMTNVEKFDASFPGVILNTSDGSSIRVKGQAEMRAAWFDDKIADQEELKARHVRWMLGIEKPTLLYADATGKKHATQEEAQQASQEWALAQLK